MLRRELIWMDEDEQKEGMKDILLSELLVIGKKLNDAFSRNREAI